MDAYIAAAPEEIQGKLREVRAAIKAAAPGAVESISYGIPYYDFRGRLAWFGLSKTHIGLYVRPPVIEQNREELSRYSTTKSAVRIPLGDEIPVPLIKKLVRARAEINLKLAPKPRTNRAERA